MEKGTFDFNSPRPFSDELDRQLRALIAQSDASIQDLASLREIGAGDKYCRHLQAKSRSATKGLRANDELNAARTRIAGRDLRHDAPDAPAHSAALQTCVACHLGVVGPSLPFAQPQALGKSLMLAGYPRGTLLSEILFRLSPTAGQEHMPRGVNLAEPERKALEDYFQALASAPPR
jgi:mono/diheme cytochrome c family protein